MPLMDKIQHKTAVIGVVGLGYVGLPLAVSFAEAGFPVIGIDTQQGKLDAICRYESYVGDISNDRLESVISSANLRVSDPNQGSKADVFVICVPTPITEDKKPDLSYISNAVKQIKRSMASRDSMVVLESSTYPGTTRDVVLPLLAGSARYVAYSPERVDPGSKKFSLKNTPKLVAGIDKESTELAALLYEQVVDKVVSVSSLEVAETAKLFENVFRNVNIALVNEMALICEKIGVSVWEVIDAAATKPFGFMPFYPGVGVGGHCFITGTWVMTEHGPRKIEAVEEGTLVLSGDGRLHRVLQKFQHQYTGEVITIKARGLPDTTMTPDHEVYIATDGRPSKQGRKHFPIHGKSTVSQLSPISKLEAARLTESSYTMWPQIRENSRIKPEHATDEYVALAGWYLSNGNIDISRNDNGSLRSARVQIALNTKHTEDVDTVHELLPTVVSQVKALLYGAKVGESSVRVQYRGTCTVFRQGCLRLVNLIADDFNQYAPTKHIPPWILWGEQRLIPILLRGMFRGDGYSGVDTGSLMYATVSSDLAFGVKILLDRIGVNSTIRTQQHHNRKHLAYGVYVANGPHALKLSKLIDFPLKTKAGPGRDTLLDRNDGYIYHRVKSVTRSQYSGLVHNLCVDETNNYVVPVGVVSNCIPVDPYYLTNEADEYSVGYTRLIHTALGINEEMPVQVARWMTNILVDKLGSMLRAKILILGVAFKRDVSDVRESPSVELIEILQSWGVDTCYNDPYVPRIVNHKTYDETSMELDDELLESVDCVVIATDHSCYDWKWIVDKAKLVFDTRNATKGIANKKIYKLGERNTE